MNITIDAAAKLAGLGTSSIRKMVKKETIPHLVQTAFGRPSYQIPLHQFSQWIDREIMRLEKKLNHLKNSSRQIKEKLNNG